MERGVRWLIRMVLDRSAAKRAEDQIEDSAERGGKRAESAFGKYAKRIAAALAAAFAIHKIIAFTREVVNLGLAGAETANKFNVTFGAASGTMDRFIAQWGRMAGLSRDQGREMLATTGAILQGLGFMEGQSAATAQQIARLAGDMTSFHNIPVEQTIMAINSALTGERERLKTLGIVVRETDVQMRALQMTGKKNVEALTDQEKAAATLELVFARMGRSVGDLERTQNSQANLLRRVQGEWRGLKERLGDVLVSGEALVPLLLQMSSAMSSLLDWVTQNQDALAAFAQGAVKVTTAAGRLVGDFIAWLKPAEAEIGRARAARLAWIREGEDEETQLARLNTARKLEQQNMIRLAGEYNNAAARVAELEREFENAGRLSKDKVYKQLAAAREELERLDVELRTSTTVLGAFADEADTVGTALREKIEAPARAAAEAVAALNAEMEVQITKLIAQMDARRAPLAMGSSRETMGPAPVKGGPKPHHGLLPTDDEIDYSTRRFLDAMQQMQDASRMAAGIITDEFKDAWGRIEDENRDLGDSIGLMFAAMRQGALGFLDTLAQQKAQENLARAIEMTAIGFGALALGNGAGASAAFTSAAQHLGAAAAWGALAAAVPGGGASGGRIGVGEPGRFDEPGGRYGDAEQQMPTTIVYIDPNDPYDPVFQEVAYAAYQQGLERFGPGARIRVRPTSQFRGG